MYSQALRSKFTKPARKVVNDAALMDEDDSKTARSLWSAQQGDGYPALADFIAQDYDDETYVFRRFKNLAARNILHLQGELIKLESDVYGLEAEAAASKDDEVHASMRSWETFDENAREPARQVEKRRQELAFVMEKKLKKYYETLLLHRQIATLESPGSRILAALRLWLHGQSEVPNGQSKLDGRDRFIFSSESDLVALKTLPDKDVLSRVLRDHLPFPSERLSPHEWDKFRHFEDRRLSWIVTSTSIAIASLLLTCPIIVLYFVTNPNARLALVITFILTFAFGISVSTSANRDAIFAATAAYSAVLVVFVSGDLANAKGP